MYFTQEDYKKIEEYLKLNGKKDTDFTNVSNIKDDDYVAIVQRNRNGSTKNVTVRIGDLTYNTFKSLIESDDERYSEIFDNVPTENSNKLLRSGDIQLALLDLVIDTNLIENGSITFQKFANDIFNGQFKTVNGISVVGQGDIHVNGSGGDNTVVFDLGRLNNAENWGYYEDSGHCEQEYTSISQEMSNLSGSIALATRVSNSVIVTATVSSLKWALRYTGYTDVDGIFIPVFTAAGSGIILTAVVLDNYGIIVLVLNLREYIDSYTPLINNLAASIHNVNTTFTQTVNSDKIILTVGNTSRNLPLATSSLAGLLSPQEKDYLSDKILQEILESVLPITLNVTGGTTLWYGERFNNTILETLTLASGCTLVSNTLSLQKGSEAANTSSNTLTKSLTINELASLNFTIQGNCTNLVISKSGNTISIPDSRIGGTKQTTYTVAYKIFTVWTLDTLANIKNGNIAPTNATVVNTGKSSNTKILYDTTNPISGEASLLVLVPLTYTAPSNWTMNGYNVAMTLLAQNVTLSSAFASLFNNVGMNKYKIYGLGTSTELITYPANTNLKIQAS